MSFVASAITNDWRLTKGISRPKDSWNMEFGTRQIYWIFLEQQIW